MPSSAEWKEYYAAHAQELLDIPWHRGGDLTGAEIRSVKRSVQEFQRGESSEGHHLLKHARDYAGRTGDADYVAAIQLFIAEEQRHARDLARLLALNGIPLVKSTFTDRVFRILRHALATLEVSIAVLITAEIIAKVYYRALRDATKSVVLRHLCDQILIDELKHVEFQAEQLRNLRYRRAAAILALTMAAQRCLFFATVHVVWLFHKPVMLRAGMRFAEWSSACWTEFDGAFADTAAGEPAAASSEPPLR